MIFAIYLNSNQKHFINNCKEKYPLLIERICPKKLILWPYMCTYHFYFFKSMFTLTLKLFSPRYQLERGRAVHEITLNSSPSYEVIRKSLLCLCNKEKHFNVYEYSHWSLKWIYIIWSLNLTDGIDLNTKNTLMKFIFIFWRPRYIF